MIEEHGQAVTYILPSINLCKPSFHATWAMSTFAQVYKPRCKFRRSKVLAIKSTCRSIIWGVGDVHAPQFHSSLVCNALLFICLGDSARNALEKPNAFKPTSGRLHAHKLQTGCSCSLHHVRFDMPVNVKAVTIMMRSPLSWGYYGINSAVCSSSVGVAEPMSEYFHNCEASTLQRPLVGESQRQQSIHKKLEVLIAEPGPIMLVSGVA